MAELRKTFRPEFLNRIDGTIMFHKLTEEHIQEIAVRMLKVLSGRLEGMDIHITFTDHAVKAIADAGFDPIYGARPLRRAVQSKIEDELAEQMLEGKFKAGSHVTCDFQEEKFVFITQEEIESAQPSEPTNPAE